jgi:hypothetical protein
LASSCGGNAPSGAAACTVGGRAEIADPATVASTLARA